MSCMLVVVIFSLIFPHIEGVKKVLVFSGGGIRATFGTLTVLDSIEGVVPWDEIHALSGGTWGLSLKNYGGAKAISAVCDQFKDDGSNEIGPSHFAIHVSGDAVENWKKYLAEFLLEHKEDQKKELESTWDKFPNLHWKHHPPRLFMHAAQLRQSKPLKTVVVVNDCYWTWNPESPYLGEFGCIVDPTNEARIWKNYECSYKAKKLNCVYHKKGKAVTGQDVSVDEKEDLLPSYPDSKTTLLESMTVSSAAFTTAQTPYALRVHPVKYHVEVPLQEHEITEATSLLRPTITHELLLTDGGDTVNVPFLQTMFAYALNPEKTIVYMFDFSGCVGIGLTSGACIYNPADITKVVEEVGEMLGLTKVEPSSADKLLESTCVKHIEYVTSYDSTKSKPLIMRLFGLCSIDKDGQDVTDFSTPFPTGQLGPQGAKRWTAQKAQMFLTGYAPFVDKHVIAHFTADCADLGCVSFTGKLTDVTTECNWKALKQGFIFDDDDELIHFQEISFDDFSTEFPEPDYEIDDETAPLLPKPKKKFLIEESDLLSSKLLLGGEAKQKRRVIVEASDFLYSSKLSPSSPSSHKKSQDAHQFNLSPPEFHSTLIENANEEHKEEEDATNKIFTEVEIVESLEMPNTVSTPTRLGEDWAMNAAGKR